jgi:hypothetical protein
MLIGFLRWLRNQAGPSQAYYFTEIKAAGVENDKLEDILVLV